ncbi:hypothetical protein [Thioalkalivibrio sp. K90mix]|uniref:hypothetical protein n=1 Tax=Thioalkalivibrio sp. (strain K90mix) TaxID=396595 RepID=UPI000376E11B|nr:hypothetical protein [Thioalkalivibrio sp. K90mix]
MLTLKQALAAILALAAAVGFAAVALWVGVQIMGSVETAGWIAFFATAGGLYTTMLIALVGLAMVATAVSHWNWGDDGASR